MPPLNAWTARRLILSRTHKRGTGLTAALCSHRASSGRSPASGIRAKHQFDNAGHGSSVPKSHEQHGNLTGEYKKPPTSGGLSIWQCRCSPRGRRGRNTSSNNTGRYSFYKEPGRRVPDRPSHGERRLRASRRGLSRRLAGRSVSEFSETEKRTGDGHWSDRCHDLGRRRDDPVEHRLDATDESTGVT